uniref:Uncharacterized protein n=1 Tax=Meloidogyne enterolobii TaxID=390850 RepID=A0A6V7V4T7_MELEN|nr:unnamed protein product [Meloidogyne enterolobii]
MIALALLHYCTKFTKGWKVTYWYNYWCYCNYWCCGIFRNLDSAKNIGDVSLLWFLS